MEIKKIITIIIALSLISSVNAVTTYKIDDFNTYYGIQSQNDGYWGGWKLQYYNSKCNGIVQSKQNGETGSDFYLPGKSFYGNSFILCDSNMSDILILYRDDLNISFNSGLKTSIKLIEVAMGYPSMFNATYRLQLMQFPGTDRVSYSAVTDYIKINSTNTTDWKTYDTYLAGNWTGRNGDYQVSKGITEGRTYTHFGVINRIAIWFNLSYTIGLTGGSDIAFSDLYLYAYDLIGESPFENATVENYPPELNETIFNNNYPYYSWKVLYTDRDNDEPILNPRVVIFYPNYTIYKNVTMTIEPSQSIDINNSYKKGVWYNVTNLYLPFVDNTFKYRIEVPSPYCSTYKYRSRTNANQSIFCDSFENAAFGHPVLRVPGWDYGYELNVTGSNSLDTTAALSENNSNSVNYMLDSSGGRVVVVFGGNYQSCCQNHNFINRLIQLPYKIGDYYIDIWTRKRQGVGSGALDLKIEKNWVASVKHASGEFILKNNLITNNITDYGFIENDLYKFELEIWHQPLYAGSENAIDSMRIYYNGTGYFWNYTMLENLNNYFKGWEWMVYTPIYDFLTTPYARCGSIVSSSPNALYLYTIYLNEKNNVTYSVQASNVQWLKYGSNESFVWKWGKWGNILPYKDNVGNTETIIYTSPGLYLTHVDIIYNDCVQQWEWYTDVKKSYEEQKQIETGIAQGYSFEKGLSWLGDFSYQIFLLVIVIVVVVLLSRVGKR